MGQKINISLFFVSFALFLYQVCLLRIFSISDYYHFAFMIVSISLLGFGISGSFLYFFIERIKNENLLLLIFSFGFSVSIIISYISINLIPFDSFRIAVEGRQILYLVIYYLFLVLPFFFGGSFVGYVFYLKEKPGITYFYNLIGSAAGAISSIFIIQEFSKEWVIYIAAATGIVAVILLMDKKNFKTFASLTVVFAIVFSMLVVFKPSVMEIRMSPYKSLPTILRYPDSEVILTKENSYAKMDVIKSPSIKSAQGLSLKYEKIPPSQMGITIDGDNLSAVTEVKQDIGELDFLNYMPQSVFMAGSKNLKNVLIIEPGGGTDVDACLYFNAENIDVVQNNSLIIEVLKDDLASFNGNIYNKNNVRVFETSSRNFSKIAEKKYNLVILSLSDSFHPVSAGAYSLNENYLYTVESLRDLVLKLEDGGMLAITRWIQFPPSENLKTLSTLAEGVKEVYGEVNRENIFAFRTWSTLTTIYKNGEFKSSEISELIKEVKRLNYDLVYYDGISEDEVNIYNRYDEPYFYRYFKTMLEGTDAEIQDFFKNYYFNIYPCTDNQPYFFNFFRFGQVPDIIKYFGKSAQPFGGGGYLILIAALLVSFVMSVIFVVLPLRIKRISIVLKKDYKYIMYFSCLGFGYFFIEMPFIQKFILMLGKPTFAMAIVLFSIMLGGGVGSYLTSKFRVKISWVVFALVLYVGCFIFGFKFIGDLIIACPLWERFLYSILLILPLGFLMGMPFPSGIGKMKETRQEVIPWAWAINGCTSVIGSIAAVIISIHFGFLIVIGIALFIYILAAVTYRYL